MSDTYITLLVGKPYKSTIYRSAQCNITNSNHSSSRIVAVSINEFDVCNIYL